MDFMLEPENIAAVSNYARYGLGVTGAEEFLDPALGHFRKLIHQQQRVLVRLLRYAMKQHKLSMIKFGQT